MTSFVAADGAAWQDALREVTGRTSVPQVFVGGQHVGGCDGAYMHTETRTEMQLFTGTEPACTTRCCTSSGMVTAAFRSCYLHAADEEDCCAIAC